MIELDIEMLIALKTGMNWMYNECYNEEMEPNYPINKRCDDWIDQMIEKLRFG